MHRYLKRKEEKGGRLRLCQETASVLSMDTAVVSRSYQTTRTSTSGLPAPRGAISGMPAIPAPGVVTTETVALPALRGVTIGVLSPYTPGETITRSSTLHTSEGALNGATASSYINWRKRDPLKHRLHLYQSEKEMGKQQGKNTHK